MVRALAKTKLLDGVHIYPRVRLGGRTIRLPVVEGVGLSNFFWHEPWLDAVIRALLAARPGAFLDVGANLGQTLLKFLAYETGHRYVGFEPNPRCAWYLETLQRVNALHAVAVVPTGLSDRSRIASLYLNGDLDPAASAVAGFRPASEYSGSKYIPLHRGDEILDSLGIGDVGIIKIDVEGGELEVLLGLHGLIEKYRPCIICEILPVYDPDTPIGRLRRERTDAVESLLLPLGYRLYRLLHSGDLVPLERVETHGSLRRCEYLFVHEGDTAAMGSLGVAAGGDAA